MLKFEPEESLQDFINKLSKKENLFSRQRRSGRLSVLPSKPNVSGMENKTRGEKCIASEGQPLMDVSNQQSKDESIPLDEAKSSSTKNVQKSALLREFHERRRSKLSSMGAATTRMNVATPSLNKPILLSSKKRTPLLSSRKKDSSYRLPFDNVKLDHHKGAVGRSVRISPSPRRGLFNSSSFKKDVSHSPYIKKDQKGPIVRPVRSSPVQRRGLLNSVSLVTGSSRKGTKDGDRNQPRYHFRNQLNKNSSSYLKINNDQDCRRALMFPEAKEEEEAETTKPLPIVELSSIKTSGSMLNRRSVISTKSLKLDKQHNSPTKLKEERLKTITEASNERIKTVNIMKHVNVRRRHSQLPTPTKSSRKNDFSQKRRSAMVVPSCRQTILVSSPLLELQDYTSPSKIAVKNIRRKSRIPLYAEEESNCSSSFQNSKPHSTSILPSITVTPLSENSGNNSFTVNEALIQNEIARNEGSVGTKDAATNTSLDREPPCSLSLKELENRKEKILEGQKRIEEAFESMTLEYFEKGKNLLIEYKNSASEGIKQLKEIFEGEALLQKHVAEKECSRCRTNLTNIASEYEQKSMKKEYKFLGTPMPKKIKKNLIRSFSDPPSPCDRSPSTRDTSFHSVDSVISPFTNIVGDCDRPSLMPMTPRMRHNVTGLKTSLNEQLEILFK